MSKKISRGTVFTDNPLQDLIEYTVRKNKKNQKIHVEKNSNVFVNKKILKKYY